ncbi:MAG: HAD family hydrolase [Sphaerochaetaceae bacterium]|nr:HAD family hydrolase [Sphaerochaetaceae bacterium]
MGKKGLIFDFNGTLFWDTWQNREAWKVMSREIRGTELSDEESAMLNGRTNPATIEYLLGRRPSRDDISRISEAKEEMYAALCLAHPERLCLAPGAEQLLDASKRADVPLAIATSCGADNLARYIEWFGLHRWFLNDRITYDRGLFPGKPHPAVYLAAARTLRLEPCDCVVFEDTRSGIESALAAGIGQVWAVASEMADIETTSKISGVSGVLLDFGDFDLASIEKQ